MKHEAATWLDRPSMEHRPVRGRAGIESKLLEQAAHPDARALVPNADADRAIFVMDAHGDDRMLEARVADTGHRQQQLAGEETRTFHAHENARLPIWLQDL
jgi:hypothetical protein